MKHRTKTALGIEISERRVSFALVEKSEQGFRVVASAAGELPDAGLPGRRARTLSQVFRRLDRRARRGRMKAAVAVSASPIVMQLLDMPRPVPTNVREFVQQELKQYVPLSGKEIRSDFCGLGAGIGPRRRLLATAVDAAQVRDVVRACGPTRTVIKAVEPAILAYTRALLTSRSQSRHSRTFLIAMLAARNLTIGVLRNGVLDFARVRERPAELDGPGPLCTWLAEELRAVAQYYESEHSLDDCEWETRVVLQDGTQTVNEISPLFSAEPGMESAIVVDPHEHLAAHAATGEGASGVAVGAALKLLDAEADDLRINLLPEELTEARRASTRLLIGANVAALVLVGLLLASQFLTRAAGAMRQEIERARLSRQLYTAPALIVQERYLDQEIARVEQRLARYQGVLRRHEVDWADVLDTIGQATPADVCVTQMACGDSRHLSLKGLAPSYDAAQAFVRNLSGRGCFDQVSLARVQRQPNDASLMGYQIDCSLRPAN